MQGGTQIGKRVIVFFECQLDCSPIGERGHILGIQADRRIKIVQCSFEVSKRKMQHGPIDVGIRKQRLRLYRVVIICEGAELVLLQCESVGAIVVCFGIANSKVDRAAEIFDRAIEISQTFINVPRLLKTSGSVGSSLEAVRKSCRAC